MDFLILLWLFLISMGINAIFFVIAFTLKSDAFTDITYALTFIILSTATIVWNTLVWNQGISFTQWVIYAIELAWAIRLGTYLFVRILKMKVDHRFDKMRDSAAKFGVFWLLQAISVWFISAPVNFALSLKSFYFDDQFFYITIVFALLAILFLAIETMADIEKNEWYRHKLTKFCKSGLWNISRHPNYFGEIMFWWMMSGLFLVNYFATYATYNSNVSYNYNSTLVWLNFIWLIAPIYITFLVNRLSGLPLLERSADVKLAGNAEYEKYVQKTSMIIPWIGRKGHYKAKKQNKKADK